MKYFLIDNTKIKPLFELLFFVFFLLNSGFAQENQWKKIRLGAGGWLTGLSIHPSGSLILAKSDVSNAWKWNENNKEWTPLITASSMPADRVNLYKYRGVLSINSAPSDKNLIYMAFDNTIFKSVDQGDTWVTTNFPNIRMSANRDESKLHGERLSIDPNNKNVVYFGSINNGLYKTTNGGDSWQVVSNILKGTEKRGIREIIFDPNSGTTNGRTNTIYLNIDGVGVYKSTDAGTSWINITAGSGFSNSVEFTDMEIAGNGHLYVSTRQFGCRKYNKNTWQNITPNNETNIADVAVDPFNNNRVIVKARGDKPFYRTTNANSSSPSWTKLTWSTADSDIPWFKTLGDGGWMSVGEITFDPIIEGKLWRAGGIGTWVSTDTNDSDISWTGLSYGQEHMVNNDIVALKNGNVIAGLWDRAMFVKKPTNFEEYADRYYPNTRFNSTWDIDVSPSNPNFVVTITEDHRFCCYDDEHRNSGYSMDGGLTWTKFESMPEPNEVNSIFGNIAVSANDINNIVWLPVGNKPAYYTKDRGKTWKKINMPCNSGNCCIHAFYLEKKVLVADRVLPNTFYIYDWGNGKIFKSEDGGVNWSTQGSVPPNAWHAKLISVDGKAGHLLYSHGPNGVAEDGVHGVYLSTDGGATWNEISNTDKVNNIAVGKAAPNSNYPTIFIQGEVNGDFGYHMSIDRGSSWKKIGTYIQGNFNQAKVMQGDPFIYGRLYVGPGSDGIYYYDINDVNCPSSGTPCDDGDPNTENDVEDGNCNCAGTPINQPEKEICSLNTQLTIDGSDADWSQNSYPLSNKILGNVTSDNDLSAKFQAQWDSEYLYILVDVTDDDLSNDSEQPYQDDSVEIYIDGGNEKSSSYDNNDHQLVFQYNSGTVYHYPANQQNPSGVNFAQTSKNSGYTLETRIAWSFIGINPEIDKPFGLDIHVNDDDNGGNRDKKITWNASSDIAWQNTAVFGTVSPKECLPVNTGADKICLENNNTPIIDGRNNDWPLNSLSIENQIVGTSSNQKSQFQTKWDSEYLYILVDVVDDILQNDSEKPYQDDSVEIYIDGDNSKSSSYDQNDHQLIFEYNNQNVYHYPANQQNPTGVTFAQTKTNSGYMIEAKIAWSFIGLNPNTGNRLGLDIHINDDDDGGDRDRKTAWNANQDIAWKDTSVFGSLQLDDCKKAKITSKTALNFFPNPTKDNLHIVFPSELKEEYVLKIYNISGTVIETKFIKEKNYILDTSELHSNLYFISITGKKYSYKAKFLKE
ncbi:sugar-binding protein [Aquimarina agarilytica]|uniref:sugar-binding protein n=1 Tax=Aquimarina agarilytica TaxID=1087449 RepID=UPI000287E531|nr:sugar-binding protein [Aquimarina agarilytica]